MVHQSMRNLRLDKRLLGRRGWLRGEELEEELERLPDVSQKAESARDAGESETPASVPEPVE